MLLSFPQHNYNRGCLRGGDTLFFTLVLFYSILPIFYFRLEINKLRWASQAQKDQGRGKQGYIRTESCMNS